MNKVYINFDDHAIEVMFEDRRAFELLDFLFADVLFNHHYDLPVIARFSLYLRQGCWHLYKDEIGVKLAEQDLNGLALSLLNHAILSFAETNTDRISLHAGLISDRAGSILLPGISGSGKSNTSLWLAHLGLSYHTDEFVTISRYSLSLSAFARPFTLRRGVMELIKKKMDLPSINEFTCNDRRVVQWRHLAFISHRLINPDFSHNIQPLKSIVFPVFTEKNKPQLFEIPRAHAGLELMRSQFGSQTIVDHGFSTITSIVKSVPSYLMVYNHFEQIEGLLSDLILLPD